MPKTHYLVGTIDASPFGDVAVCAVATGLSRTEAARRLAALQTLGRVAFLGSASLRVVEVRLPEDVSGGLGSSRASVRRVANWLEMLRAHGQLRFDMLAPGLAAPIEPTWVGDPVVLACLGVVLAPCVPSDDPAPDDLPTWIASAPPTSIAGLLAASPRADAFAEWMQVMPAHAWAPLTIPLYAAEDAGQDGWRVGWWSVRDHYQAFLAGEAVQLTITATRATCNLLPVDRSQGWALVDPRERRATDPCWRLRGDPRLDSALRALPALSASVLLRAAGLAIEAGADPTSMLDFTEPLRSELQRKIERAGAALTDELLRRTQLTGLRHVRLSHARYFHDEVAPIVVARRSQVLHAWPALADDLAAGAVPAAAAAIDAGHPLVPALARDYAVAPWVARRLLSLLGEGGKPITRELGGPRLVAKLLGAAGKHAPTPTRDDLPTIAAWLRAGAASADGPAGTFLMRALGNEAARCGWHGVEELLDRPEIVETAIHLLAWWDHLLANVEDHLARAAGEPVPAEIADATLFYWLAKVPVTTQLRLATGWHHFLWGEEVQMEIADSVETPALFGPLTLVRSRVQVTPLVTTAALREEGQALQHCVHSYRTGLATGRRVMMALQAQSGERATVAWQRLDTSWVLEQLRGKRNQRFPETHDLERASIEMYALLHETDALSPEAVTWHRAISKAHPIRGCDYATDGNCLISTLPERLVAVALKWFPGKGSLDQRLAVAYAKAPNCTAKRGNENRADKSGNC